MKYRTIGGRRIGTDYVPSVSTAKRVYRLCERCGSRHQIQPNRHEDGTYFCATCKSTDPALYERWTTSPDRELESEP